jgi:tetratricopeptide (TPR) repeat protein
MDAHRPCPDSALLAAFLDGALADFERTAVVTHLAECAQCRAVALTVVEFREVEALDEIWQVATGQEGDAQPSTRVRQWARWKTRAPALVAAMVGAVTVAAASLFYFTSSRPASPDAVLVSAADGQRLTHARLSGGFPFASPDATPSAHDARLIRAVNRVRDTYGTDYAAPARRTVGVASLLVGELSDAVASLSIASLAAPNDARIANDLAAAYYERAQRAGRPDDLPAALDAAERAVRLQPDLLEAWFNRALVVTALGLPRDARAAWQAYQQRDPNSPWTDEARRRERDLTAEAPLVWRQLQERILDEASLELATTAVTTHPGEARALFDNSLEEWTAAARHGRDLPLLRARLRALGTAFEQVQRERFYQDVATSVDVAVAGRRHRALAQAHADWFEANRSISQKEWAEAEQLYQRAATRLSAADSPLALGAQIELATTDYYRHRFDRSVAALPALKAQAAARKYRVLDTRASWMTGLAEYSRNNLPAARVAYEQMLESARPPADIDQFVMASVLLANVHYLLGNNTAAWSLRVAAMPLVEHCQAESTISNALMSAAGHAAAGGHFALALLLDSTLHSSTELEPAAETQARIQRASTLHRLGHNEAAQIEVQGARQQLAMVKDVHMLARREAELLAIESELLQPSDPEGALRLAEQAARWASRSGDRYVVSGVQLRVADAALATGDLDRADSAATRAIAQIAPMRGSSSADGALPADYELPLYAKAAQIALRRGDFSRAFEYVERRRLRTLHENGGTVSAVLSLKDIQQQLDPETALAVLNQIDDQLHTWIITRDDVVVQSTDVEAARAAALVLAQTFEISRLTSSPTVSGELFDTLFRPVWRHLSRVQTIVVVADAPYNKVAFAGLWDGTRQKYLVEDFQLVSAPSATTFATGTRHAFPGPRAAQRLAVLTAASDEADSRFGRDLGRDLAMFYEASQLRAGGSVTPSELLRQIGQRDVVHISAAVMGSRETGARTRLVVADEPGRKYSGSLSTTDLATAKQVRARLVTLDTSSAEGNEPASADSVQELTRALLAAGVSTVVGSVGAPSSGELDGTWIEFHRQYAAGITPAESLRRAQLAALNASNRRPGPWATLTVFGANQ